MRSAVLAAVILLGISTDARADAASAPPFVFTEAQVRVIVEILVQKRDAAAAEYQRLDQIVGDVMRQAQAREKPKDGEAK